MKSQTYPAARRCLALAAFVAVSASGGLLSGCGSAENMGEGMGKAVGEAIVCTIANCKDSETVKTEDISPQYQVSQSGNSVTVTAKLGQSANLLTTVRLSGADRLSARIGAGQPVDLRDSSSNGMRLSHAASLVHAGEQPSVSISLHRGAEAHISSATPPKPFAILAPTGMSALTRASGAFDVRLGLASGSNVSNHAGVNCLRSDGSRFESLTNLPFALESASPAHLVYRLQMGSLDTLLNQLSSSANSGNATTPLVKSCELSVAWSHNVVGQLAPTLSRHGSIVGQYTVNHAVVYDAQR